MIYLDLVFLVNWLMDGILLLATGWTRRLRVRMLRVALASGIGSLYVLLILAPNLAVLYTFGAKLAVSIVMVGVSFGFVHWQQFLRNLAAFYLIAFATAGCIYGLYYFFLPPAIVMGAVVSGVFEWSTGFAAGFGFIGVCFVLGIWMYMRVFRGAKQKEALVAHIARVEVEVKGFSLSCTGLVDTGNQLYDPLTKTPVMIVETALWKSVLPKEWIDRMQSTDADEIVATMGQDEFVWQDRLRIVPYRGVNKTASLMLAIKPDCVRIVHEGRVWETSKVLIGLDGGTLSMDGAYQAIIHPMLLQE